MTNDRHQSSTTIRGDQVVGDNVGGDKDGHDKATYSDYWSTILDILKSAILAQATSLGARNGRWL